MQIFKKKNNFRKKEFGFNANLYWEFAALFAALFIAASFVFGYLLFLRIDREFTLSPENGSVRIPMLDRERLGNALHYFSEREKKSAEIINSPSPVVDPS
jgi:hypothetical protein